MIRARAKRARPNRRLSGAAALRPRRAGEGLVRLQRFVVLLQRRLRQHALAAGDLVLDALDEPLDLDLARPQRLAGDLDVDRRRVGEAHALVVALLETAHGDPRAAVDLHLLLDAALERPALRLAVRRLHRPGHRAIDDYFDPLKR